MTACMCRTIYTRFHFMESVKGLEDGEIACFRRPLVLYFIFFMFCVILCLYSKNEQNEVTG